MHSKIRAEVSDLLLKTLRLFGTHTLGYDPSRPRDNKTTAEIVKIGEDNND